MKGHPRLLLSNGCDNNCKGKDPNSWVLVFPLSAARLLIKRCKKPDSCWSKGCTLILGHTGRTAANLGIKKLAIAPLNYIKSSSYLLLLINKWIYYACKWRAGSQGWEQIGRGHFAGGSLGNTRQPSIAAATSPGPSLSLPLALGPRGATVSPALGHFSPGTASHSWQSVRFDMRNNKSAIKRLPPVCGGWGSGSPCISYLPPSTLKGLFLNCIWISQSGISFFWGF